MNNDQIIKLAEVICAGLAWPIFGVFLVFQARKLLPLIQRVKVQDVEFEFKKTIEQIEVDRSSVSPSQITVQKTDSLMPNMLGLAEISPNAVTLQAFALAEHRIISLAQEVQPSSFWTSIPALQYIVEKGFADEKYLNLFLRIYAVKERLIYTEERRNSKDLSLEVGDVTLAIVRDIEREFREVISKEKRNKRSRRKS